MASRSILDTLLALLFPDRCAGCERLGDLLCGECRAALAPYPAEPAPALPGLDGARIAFVFDGPLRGAVHQFKYRRARRMAGPLGALLSAALAARPLPAEALLPIPLHPARQAERGFNQAEVLAREVERALRLPLAGAGLARIRATEQQAQLDARARTENMRGAFRWQGAAPPRRVILVDDVLTTGATMAACADALRAAGTEKVYGLALARSRLDR